MLTLTAFGVTEISAVSFNENDYHIISTTMHPMPCHVMSCTHVCMYARMYVSRIQNLGVS